MFMHIKSLPTKDLRIRRAMSTSKMKALVQVKHRIRQRLDEVCGVGASGMGLNCNVEDLEAICREVRTEMMLETNEILKRRRKRGKTPAQFP